MKNVLVFAGSNSSTSINKQLATYAASLLEDVNLDILDLNDYEMPIYSIDLEKQSGVPDKAKQFLDKIKSTDGIVLSLAEHNGAYSVAFKNVFDWMSRIDGNLWNNKPMLLMATSPGGRGGATVLEIAKGKFPRMNADIVASFSLPLFNDNFKGGKIIDEDLNKDLVRQVEQLQKAI